MEPARIPAGFRMKFPRPLVRIPDALFLREPGVSISRRDSCRYTPQYRNWYHIKKVPRDSGIAVNIGVSLGSMMNSRHELSKTISSAKCGFLFLQPIPAIRSGVVYDFHALVFVQFPPYTFYIP